MSAYDEAKIAIEALESYAAQVEEHEREGDVGALLSADSIALSILAVADAINEASRG